MEDKKTKGFLKEFQKELTHSLIINLGALFAYPSYLIRYSTEHIAVCASLYKQTSDIDDVLLKKNLTTNNKETQKKISKLTLKSIIKNTLTTKTSVKIVTNNLVKKLFTIPKSPILDTISPVVRFL